MVTPHWRNPPARDQGHSAPPRDILPSWTLLDGERTTKIPQKAALEQEVASRGKGKAGVAVVLLSRACVQPFPFLMARATDEPKKF